MFLEDEGGRRMSIQKRAWLPLVVRLNVIGRMFAVCPSCDRLFVAPPPSQEKGGARRANLVCHATV